MQPGIQVSSLKPRLLDEAQVRAAFANMKALGCGVVQLQWIHRSVPAEAIATAMAENDMVSVGVQDFYDLVQTDFEYYVNLNAVTSGKWLCVSRITERLKSREGLDAYVAELRDMQKQLDAYDQKLCFHPVSTDFAAIPGFDAVGYLLDAMPELDICLDLYHLNRNCADMPAYIRKYAGRVCMVHFKDALGDTLVPAGQGAVNWEGVVRACLDTGVPYGFAEQERWDRDPYECLGEALEWLRKELEG